MRRAENLESSKFILGGKIARNTQIYVHLYEHTHVWTSVYCVHFEDVLEASLVGFTGAQCTHLLLLTRQ